MTVSDEFRQKLTNLQDRFDDAVTAAQDFQEWMEQCIEDGKSSKDEIRQQLSRRLPLQLEELRLFIEFMDDKPADSLLRMQDRVCIIELTESGKFV